MGLLGHCTRKSTIHIVSTTTSRRAWEAARWKTNLASTAECAATSSARTGRRRPTWTNSSICSRNSGRSARGGTCSSRASSPWPATGGVTRSLRQRRPWTGITAGLSPTSSTATPKPPRKLCTCASSCGTERRTRRSRYPRVPPDGVASGLANAARACRQRDSAAFAQTLHQHVPPKPDPRFPADNEVHRDEDVAPPHGREFVRAYLVM